MEKISRRTLLGGAAVLPFAAAARGRHAMQYHLSCGALGVKANQKEAIGYAAQYGFDVVDADGKYLGGLSDSELHNLLDEMQSKQVGWAIAGLPVEFRKDDDTFSSGIKTFPEYVKGLKRAGVQRVTTWVMPMHSERTYRKNFEVHANRLREVAAVLNDSGLRFGLEYVGPKTLWAAQRYSFVHTMTEMKELIAEIDKPNVGFVLDSWHWYTSGETGADLLTLRADQVVSVDLNDAPAGIPVDQQVDSRRELPAATGVIDVKTFLGSLKKIGYQGPVRAEPFNEVLRRMPAAEALTATIASIEKAFSQIA
jgi:sugar phosphate isomerase/epimerase